MMGSTCCKSPYSPTISNLGKIFFNCPLQFCYEMGKEEEQVRVKPSRKFSSSDISGPLPLGTVIVPPERPPRKRKRKLSRCRSVPDLSRHFAPEIVQSKSAMELRFDNIECSNMKTPVEEQPTIRLSPLVLPVDAAPPPLLAENKIISNSSPKVLISQPIDTTTPQIHKFITLNKRTFLAGLLEQNNNLQNADVKDTNTASRRSSITESLREFESSLYDMLQENAEDERSEHSLHLPQVIAR